MRMNRQHGAGLKNLKASLTGSYKLGRGPSPGGDPAVHGQNLDGSYVVNQYTIYPHMWQALPLGAVSGMQYQNNTFGQCFYSVADTLSFGEYFKADWISFITTGEFYQMVVYDPIRLLSNYLALYE